MTTRRPQLAPTSSCRRTTRRLPAVVTLLCLVLPLIGLASGCNRAMSLDEIRDLQAKGRYAATVEPLRKRLESTPDDAETHYLYGTALSRTGASRVAVWSLRKAAETPEWKVRATLELSGAQARSENWDASIEAADTVLEIEPENLAAHIVRGEAYLGEGTHPERALEDFDFVIEKEPTSFSALNSRASALLLLGKIDEAAEAIDQLEALVDKNSGDEVSQAHLCAAQAVLRQERGEKDEAEKRLADCLERFPAYAVVIDPAISFFDAKGDRARSNAILETALDVAPMSVSYRRTLALRLEADGESDRALAVLKDGLKTENRELLSAVWTDITNYHLDRDEIPEAIDAYEQALALNEHPPEMAILTHADLLARAGRHADALRVAKGLENKSYAGLIEARIALDEGNPKQALERLDAVFPIWPNNAGARYYAARAAEQMGDFRRAIDEYRQSMRSAPEQTEAALRLAKLFLAAGEYEDAWNSASQYMSAHGDDPEGARVIIASASRDDKASLHGLFAQLRGTPLWPAAVAARAQFVADRRKPDAALTWIAEVAGADLDWTLPANAELLRVRVLLLEAAGRGPEAKKTIAAAWAAHPEYSGFLEIKAALLEASGGEVAAVLAEFEGAVAKDAKNWLALEGVARSRERAGDAPGALEFYDRATKVHPESPTAARHAANLATTMGDKADAEKRWNELLKEHPWDPEAARSLVDIRAGRHQTDALTLDYAERAVMFGGGKEAEALLIRVYEARGEVERAREATQAFKEGKALPPRNSGSSAQAPKASTDASNPKQS